MKLPGITTAVLCLSAVLCAIPGLTEERKPDDDPWFSVDPANGWVHQESSSLKWLGGGDVLATNPSRSEIGPSMASAPNGDLYVAVDDLGSSAIYIYRSTDSGTTWSHFAFSSVASDSRHPSIAYAEGPDDEKWIFVAFEMVNADDSRQIWVLRFDRDNPGTLHSFAWVDGPMSMGSPSEPIQPRITTDTIHFGSSYFVYVTYTGFSSSTYPVFVSRSEDRGLTWSTPDDVTGGSASTTWPARPDIAFGYAGLFITYVKPGGTAPATANKIWVTESNNFGGVWRAPVQLTAATTQSDHPTVAAAHDRNVVLVVTTREPLGFLDLASAYSMDGGSTWTLNRELPHTLDTEWIPDLEASHALSGTGSFHVSFKGIEDGQHGIWYTHAATSAPDVWATPIRVSESTTVSSTFARSAIAVDPTDSATTGACVAWTDHRTANYGAYFARDWPVFADGFESGNTIAWSTTVGGP